MLSLGMSMHATPLTCTGCWCHGGIVCCLERHKFLLQLTSLLTFCLLDGISFRDFDPVKPFKLFALTLHFSLVLCARSAKISIKIIMLALEINVPLTQHLLVFKSILKLLIQLFIPDLRFLLGSLKEPGFLIQSCYGASGSRDLLLVFPCFPI